MLDMIVSILPIALQMSYLKDRSDFNSLFSALKSEGIYRRLPLKLFNRLMEYALDILLWDLGRQRKGTFTGQLQI